MTTLESLTRQAFALGYAERGPFPLDRRSRAAMRAAVGIADDFAEADWVIEMVFEAGKREGLIALILRRRKALSATAIREAASMAGELAAEVDLERLREQLEGATNRDDARAIILALLLAALGHRKTIHTAWVALIAEMRASARAEGIAAAVALVALLSGQEVDMDGVYEELLGRLRAADGYAESTDSWIAEQLGGMAGDGADAFEGHHSIAAALALGAGAAFYMDESMHRALTDAMVAQVAETEHRLAFETMEDDRVCALCDSLAASGPYPPSDFPGVPQHGGCRCWPMPVS